MTNAEKLTLAKHACHIRMGVIEGTHSAKCGHPGGSLDIAEVLSYLYFVDMNIDPKEPKKPDRDRFVLSKGHAAPALYATLAERGFFPVEDLKTLRILRTTTMRGEPNAFAKIHRIKHSGKIFLPNYRFICNFARDK